MNAITKGGYQDVPMTRRRAQLLEEYASKLADMLEAAPNDKDLAEWVQSKIDRAAAAIQSAYHYLDQDDESELEKARVLKYDYRRPSKTRFNKKTGKREWDYFYTKKHGARVTRGAFEAGAAFRMTWKGRKGHFHIHHVKGDQVFITHDSRPDMEPIPVQADELRALLERQHKREVDQHLKRKTREVEEIKRRAHRGGLGLALHRLRQAAAQAGVSLPEQYQRKPKKTRAPSPQPAREVETQAPQIDTPRTKAETARAIHKDLEQAGFKGARIWVVDGGTGKEKARIYIKGKWNGVTSESGYLDIMTRTHYTDAGEAEPTRDIGLDLSGAPSLKNSQVIPFLEMLDKHRDLLLDPSLHLEGDRDDNRIKGFLDHFSQTDYTKLDPENPLQDHDEKAQALARARGADTLSDLAASINNALYSLLRKQVKPVIEENARKIYGDKETPRDQLTSTAQQIIEDANQEHAERHDEHQEITRFELGEHVHTKTGAKLFTAKQTERVERDEYFRRLEIAKRHGGRYERRYVRGFVFKSAEDARAFALEVEGAAPPETSAETVTPHDEHPGADNFETMPEVESAPTQRLRGVLDALSESERLNTINPKNRKRPKEAKGADAKLIKLINELAEDQDPNERRFLKVMASMLQDVKRQYPRSAYERRESRKDRYATIREFIEKKLGVEPTATAPNLGEILSRPTTPSTRPSSAYYGRATKKLVDQALSSEPTGIDLNNARSVLPSKGDLREMLSQEQRLKRAKEDLVSTGAPNFLGQRNPIQDIMYALDRYLNGPYVELGQGRIREMERGLKIALRDSKGEELEQVKDETARFWREWGGEYKRLQEEFARGRTQGQALRNIRPLIPKHALTPEINQQLDQMEQELDQRPVTGHDIARWIDTRDTNQATRDRQPTTPREQLTETAREVTQGADNFETMPEVEARDLKAYKRVRRLARKAEKLDRATGRRTNESKKADQSLAQAARSLLETEFADLPSTQEISRKRQTRLTPEEARKAAITGALNKLERNQTASRAGSAAQAYENRSEARAILETEMRDRLEAAAPLPTPRDRGPQIEEPPRTTIYDGVPLAKPRPEPRAQTVDKYTAAIYSERLDTKPAFKYSDARSAIERYQDGATSTKADRKLLEVTAGDLSPFIHRLLAEHRPVSLGLPGADARYQRYKDYADHAGFTIPSQMELTAPGRSDFEIIKKIGLHLLSSVNLTETSTRGDLTKELARGFAQYDEATRDKQPTAPARQALTETAEKIISEPPPAPAVQADFDTSAIQEAIDNGHELTPVIALQRQFIERRNAGLLTPALLKESLRIYETMIEKGVEAKIKKKKKGVLLNYIASNISAMTAYRLKSEKKQEAVEEMMSSFIRNVTNTPLMKERRNNVTYNIFDLQDRETDIERIKRLVSEYTEEDAIEDNRRLKAEIAQAEQQRAERERVQANPQTAQDYIELKRLKRNKGEELSAEQHAKHNDLVSRSRREKREANKPRQAERQKAKRDALRERLEGYRDNANEALNADRRTNTARRARFARYATEDAFRRIEYVNKSQRVLDAIDEGRAYHLKNISNATDLDMLQSIIDRAKSDEASAQGQQWSDYEKTRDKLKAAPIPQNALESRDLYPDKLQLFSADIKSLKKYLTRKDGTARRGARTALAELNAMLSEPKEKRHTVSMDTLTRVLSHVPPETDKSYGVLSRVVELKRDHDRMKRLGIENELELKAALREYEDIVYQLSPEDERAHKEAEQAKAERDRLIRRGEFARMNIPSYFPTPASVIDRMIEIAGIEEGETVLEPSAGAGHILEKLADTKASVKAIEANVTLRDYLQDQGHEVVGNDSLEHSDTYDHVIMNPPFEKQADIDHVTHAFENNLVEGGRLVAVMSASAMTRDNKKARDFQELVNKYGQYEKLPQGTFKDSDRQTGVNTILVTLDLPTKGLRKGMRQPTRATKNSHRAQLIQTVERLTAA